MKTLLLDQDAWDLVLDAYGNIAVAREPYAIAQDVASAVRTFLGECWYNTELGMPYFSQIMDKLPPESLIKTQIVQQAATVPGVASVQTVLVGLGNDRRLTGQIQITTDDGTQTEVDF